MNGHEPRHLNTAAYRPRHLKQTAADSRAHSGRQSVSARAGKPASKIRRDIDIERVEKALDRSLIRKNTANICVSAVILLLGVTSFLYGLTLEPSVTIFRFLTVDGTLFTTCGALACIIINLVEIFRREDIVFTATYYIRLSMAVAESVIFIVVVFSQLPVFAQHLPMFDRYDSFVMHVVIPILGVASFLFNDSPIGKLSPEKCLLGASYVSVYAVIIVTLISTERLPVFLSGLPHQRHRDLSAGVRIRLYRGLSDGVGPVCVEQKVLVALVPGSRGKREKEMREEGRCFQRVICFGSLSARH